MPTVSEPCISGANVLDGRASFEQIVGARAFAEALATLPPADLEIYNAATAISWVPIRIVDMVITATAFRVGRDPVEINVEATRRAVDRTVKTLWRALLRFTSDEALLARTPVFHSKSFSHGRLAATFPSPKSAQLVLSEWPTVSNLQIAGLGAGIEAVLTAAGRKDASVTSTRTSDGARYRAVWK